MKLTFKLKSYLSYNQFHRVYIRQGKGSLLADLRILHKLWDRPQLFQICHGEELLDNCGWRRWVALGRPDQSAREHRCVKIYAVQGELMCSFFCPVSASLSRHDASRTYNEMPMCLTINTGRNTRSFFIRLPVFSRWLSDYVAIILDHVRRITQKRTEPWSIVYCQLEEIQVDQSRTCFTRRTCTWAAGWLGGCGPTVTPTAPVWR